MVKYFCETFGMKVLIAKAVAESLLYLANFVIQRDIIFAASQSESRTDWDAYYRRQYAARLAGSREAD